MKTKKILGAATLLLALGMGSAYAQVGMPTNNPQRNAQLDLNGANSQNNKGLLLPRVSLVATDNVAPLVGTVLSGMKVYNLATAGAGATAVTPGEYYYDGTKWVRIAAEGSTSSGGAEPWYDVATQAGATANTQDIYQIGKVGIGKNNPQAQLDVSKDALINNITVGLGGGQVVTNTTVGNYALKSNTTGNNNSAVGINALSSNSTGNDNSAFGANVLTNNTTGKRNTGIGYYALHTSTTGDFNTAVGTHALYSNTIGTRNIAVGNSALYLNTTGFNNSAMGVDALGVNTTGNENSALGTNALNQNTTGKKNTAVGIRALQANTTADYNTAIGGDALVANTTGTQNSAVGVGALSNTTTGSYNSSMGVNALNANTTGRDNTAMGVSALTSNTTGDGNIALGVSALQNNKTGDTNIAVGYQALQLGTTGSGNIAVGTQTLQINSTGNSNIAVGGAALNSNTTGSTNVALGHGTLFANSQGRGNIAIGDDAASNSETGSDNIAIGTGTLSNNITGNENIAIGNRAGSVDRNNTICIGRDAAVYGDNEMSIGNLIYGNGMTNVVGEGNIGIGTNTPTQKLHVRGGIRVNQTGGAFSGLIWNGSSSEDGIDMVSNNEGTNIAIQRSGNNACLYLSKTSTGNLAEFFSGGRGQVGSITFDGTNTNFNRTSDKRLKENIIGSHYGVADVMKMGIYDYNYKADAEKRQRTGVIAQELFQVYPQAVTVGGADEKTSPWSVDYSTLVPVLIKAMQEQQTQIETQNARIEALEKQMKTLMSK